MKKNDSVNKLFQNDRFLFIFSFFLAIAVWVAVVVLASPQTTRTIKKVDVTVDDSLVSQFGLKVFGDSDFKVDVTVSGKKYQVSHGNLDAEDIVIEAVTTGVNSAGYYNLQLRAADDDGDNSYKVKDISPKTIRVYFDTEKTVEFAVESKIKSNDFPIVKKGYTYGDATISEPTVSVTGPSGQVDRIKKVVAEVELEASLTSNTSTQAELVALDKDLRAVTEFITLSVENAIVNIPVFRVKNVNSIVTFKNTPSDLVSKSLKYKITPAKTDFNIIVDEYNNTNECSVGVIDYKMLSPSNNVFRFIADETTASNPKFKEFVVTVDMSEYSQEYIEVSSKKVNITNPDNLDVSVYGLDKTVLIVGKEADLMKITEDMISVSIDLSLMDITAGEAVSIPAVVSVDSPSCWVYGTYSVKVKLK